MKILITGAAGFLGQRIARRLLAQGARAVVLHVRRVAPAGLVEGLQRDYPDAHIEVAAANLLARGTLGPMVQGVDCIVHAAAGMKGAAADMFANTVLGSRNLLEAAGPAGVRRIVLVSSFSIYRTEDLPDDALLDERVPREAVGIEKGAYAYAKTRQEQLFDEFQKQYGFESVVLRPGVIYGPGGGAMSPRVGLSAMGLFASLGGSVVLPLTYVENCADAIAVAALKAPAGSAFNVVDDDLPTCADYLRQYRRNVKSLRVFRLPYPVFLWASKRLQGYHKRSKGQLPAVFTPYVVRSMYRPLRYTNAALKALGWTPAVSTAQGLDATWKALRGA
ncbi:NAD-dependent epimerase/dehydratase family protein [Piscinibacter sp.]|uniref:NAD-dependent epimerase/dehydratase family protein n=1 Tax=Piscinibacter sp. TaxID=1903157 RepID=UPI0039E61F25